MTSATVFPDTTILIQYEALDRIDWESLFGVHGIKLVLAPSVLQEIEDIKNQDISTSLAERAVEALETIEKLKAKANPKGVITHVLFPEEPDIDFFAENLDDNSVADLLVASVIDYQGSSALDYIMLLTEDKETRIKAMAAGIEVPALPRRYRLDLSVKAAGQLANQASSAHHFPIADKLSKPTTLFKNSEKNTAASNNESNREKVTPLESIQEDTKPLSKEDKVQTPLLTLSDIGLNGLTTQKRPPENKKEDDKKPPASTTIVDIIQEPIRLESRSANSSPHSKVSNQVVPRQKDEEKPSLKQDNLTPSFSFVSQTPPSPPPPAEKNDFIPADPLSETPDLRLSVGDEDESLTTVVIHHPVYPSLDDVNKHLASIRSRYPKLQLPYEPGGDGVGSDLISSNSPYGSVAPDILLQRKAQRIKKYNSSLDTYYSGIEKYLSDNAEYENFKRRSAQLNLTLFNDLPDSLKSLYISVHFPGNVRVYYDDNLPERPASPASPEEPDLEMLFDPIRLPLVPVPNELSPGADIKMRGRNLAPMEVRWNKGWDVIYSIREIDKNSHMPFNPLYIAFNSFDHATSFRVNYRITVASASYEQLGDLEIIVRKEI